MIVWCRYDNSVNEGGGLSDKVTSLLLKSTVSLQSEAAAMHGSARSTWQTGLVFLKTNRVLKHGCDYLKLCMAVKDFNY